MGLWFRFLPHDKLVKLVLKGITEAVTKGNLDYLPVVGRSEEVNEYLAKKKIRQLKF